MDELLLFPEVHMKLRDMFLRPVLLVILAAGVVLPAAAWAQSDARISGSVRDSQGASVPNASVSVKNDKTGEQRSATTNTQGFFVVGGLKPSTYTVRVAVGSFAPLEYPNMPLAAAAEQALDFALKPPGLTESGTVTADAPALDAH